MNESSRLGLLVCASMIVALWLPMGGCDGEQQDGASKNGERSTETTVAGETSQRTSTSIAFQSDRDGDFELYAMDSDGTDQLRLTDNPAYDGEPAFSPEGKKVAFTSDRDGSNDVYVMDSDGTNEEKLTDNPWNDTNPAFSSDGNKVAFVTNRDGSNEIYVATVDDGK